MRSVTTGLAAIRKSPDAEAEQVNELRFGDRFTVYQEREGWAFGQSQRDNYVGYVRLGALGKCTSPTHRIGTPVSLLFPEPSIKAPPIDRLTFLSMVEQVGEEEKFCEIKGGGFIHRAHLRKPSADNDWVAVASRFIDTPYLWGGISPLGCDCSGLVQTALNACGIACPRDSDMQADMLGSAADPGNLQRGDVVCFKGHVGLMMDSQTMIHANAWHGRVVIEPLSEVVGRGDAITAVRRLQATLDKA